MDISDGVKNFSFIPEDNTGSNETIPTTKEKDSNEQERSISFFSLFRYSSIWERILTIIGSILAILTGVVWPILIVIYAEYTEILIARTVGNGTIFRSVIFPLFGGGRHLSKDATYEERMAEIYYDANAFGISSIIVLGSVLIVTYLSVTILNYSAQNQTMRLRNKFLESILRQDIGWYDTHNSATFATKITQNLDKIQDGIGERITISLYFIVTFISITILSFVKGWKLSLVVFCCAPFIVIATTVVAKIQSSLAVKELNFYGTAGAIVEEVIGAIRTVIAFEGQNKEVERYKGSLGAAHKMGIRRGLFSGLGGGVNWLIIYLAHAIAIWYGVVLILDDRHLPEDQIQYTPAILVIILFGVITGAMNLGLATPHLEAFAMARGAAPSVFAIMDRKPTIDSLSEDGIKLEKIEGNIQFNNVHFNYPNRPSVKILQGLNLEIRSGQTVALVGTSGCGKSTSIQLIQRFYDPSKGMVTLDGHDLRSLHVGWLRGQMGIVGQEPSLFDISIKENIRLGNKEATDEEIITACKQANAHDFIKALPMGYDTKIGERGSQISGGQKQRIAIARALIKQPKILLLDEATSALDTQSEAEVQAALDRAKEGRTTIIVAHRLSTIAKADKIFVLDQGILIESGSPQELLEKPNGMFQAMAKATHNDNLENKEEMNSELEDEDILTNSRTLKTSLSLLSIKKDEKNEEEVEEDPDTHYQVPLSRLLKLNKPELPHFIVGFISSIAIGITFSLFAIIFGELFDALSIQNDDDMKSYCYMIGGLFVVLGFFTGVGTFLQIFLFSLIGVRLTTRIRISVFESMLKQEAAWFDQPNHRVGKLCARLFSDATNVQGTTGTQMAIIIQSIATILVGVGLSLYYSWKLTLTTIIFIPFVFVGVYLDSKVVQSQGVDEKLAIQSATKIAVEAISNIRTVASLGAERVFLEKYVEELQNAIRSSRRKTALRGVIFGLGQTVPILAYTFCLFYGGYLVSDGEMYYPEIIKVSESLIFGAWQLGNSLVFAPNLGEARAAAGRLFSIIDRKPAIRDSEKTMNQDFEAGDINYNKVEFSYPTRSLAKVLRGLDLHVPHRKSVALVGSSGCGKSTCIQLLQRLYDPISGSISVNGLEISSISVGRLRASLGIVSQEPFLFDLTLGQNIAYGDNSREVPMAEIIESARNANIHDFITSLPEGYDTRLGTKGAQLSGGQKQRVAIARALVRNPKILLLDEATSALDSQSEKVVQAALDKASAGRTCITIAHRLATIQNADLIYVIHDGLVLESGTHSKLMAKGGKYYELYQQSTLKH